MELWPLVVLVECLLHVRWLGWKHVLLLLVHEMRRHVRRWWLHAVHVAWMPSEWHILVRWEEGRRRPHVAHLQRSRAVLTMWTRWLHRRGHDLLKGRPGLLISCMLVVALLEQGEERVSLRGRLARGFHWR